MQAKAIAEAIRRAHAAGHRYSDFAVLIRSRTSLQHILDAVEVCTIHKAKGLEWPVVFVPSVIGRRFPTGKLGQPRTEWHVPRHLFDEQRYNGTLNDERRLFYVSLTRARDQVLVSFFDSYPSERATPRSPLLRDAFGDRQPLAAEEIPLPPTAEQRQDVEPPLEVALSDLLLYDACGMSFRLRSMLGFQPVLARELGYGRAVHHILRLVAEHVSKHGEAPSDRELEAMLDSDFYLPLATKPTHLQLKRRAGELVRLFIEDHAEELRRSWAVERPFEPRTAEALISGRADVILSDGRSDGVEASGRSALTLVDYKTSSNGDEREDDSGGASQFEFQLQVYGDAGTQEGLDIAGAYIHDLVGNERITVSVSSSSLRQARSRLDGLIGDLRAKRYAPKPVPGCGRCDVAPICRHRAA